MFPRLKLRHAIQSLGVLVLMALALRHLLSPVIPEAASAEDHHILSRLQAYSALRDFSSCDGYFSLFLDHYSRGEDKTQYSRFSFEGETLDTYLEAKKQEILKENHISSTDLRIQEFFVENPISKETLAEWTKEFHDKVAENEEVIELLKQQTIDTRVFNECYIKNREQLKVSCEVVEKKLFPWLTRIRPTIDGVAGQEIGPQGCMLQTLHRSSSGKGMVLTAGDQHIEDVFSLVVSLRLHKTALPLEVIYRGTDLSEENRVKVQRLATEPITDSNIADVLLTNGLSNSENFAPPYPPLTVRFVNITDCITPDFQERFNSFKNKFLATIFNSFAEFIILDADVVLLKSPEWFFTIPEYKSTGTFFFKDRELPNRASSLDKPFWVSLFPTQEENELFSTPLVDLTDPQVTTNRYFNGFTHFMESGLVVWNKERHMAPLIHAMQLQLWNTATKRVWGDKEFFWISMLISGNVNYGVNEHQCGAIGVEERIPHLLRHEEEKGVCSVQLVHVYNGGLCWMNSGFKYCKFEEAFEMEFQTRGALLEMNEAQFKEYFFGSVKVQDVVVPPSVDDYYLSFDPEHDVERYSWRGTKRCRGYSYCAKGELRVPGETRQGVRVVVDEQMRNDLQHFGDAWVNGPKIAEKLAGVQQ